MIFGKKTAYGNVVTQEVKELSVAEPEVYGDIVDDLMGLFTTLDIEQLTGHIPIGSSAVVILFEHALGDRTDRNGVRGRGSRFHEGDNITRRNDEDQR